MTAASPQELVEHALKTTTSDQCVGDRARLHQRQPALGEQHPDHQRRDARRHGHGRRLPRHRRGHRRRARSPAAPPRPSRSPASSSRPTPPRRASSPAEDAAELPTGDAAADWFEPSGETSIEVYSTSRRPWARRSAGPPPRTGSSTASWTTTSRRRTSARSTGLRLRHVQPTGHYGCTAKPTDLSTSAWVGGATRDFSDVDAHAMDAELVQRLGWAVAARGPRRPAATTRCCRRPRSRT